MKVNLGVESRMFLKKLLLVCFVISFVLLATCGCGGPSDGNDVEVEREVPITSHQEKNGFEIDFSIPKRGFSLGEEIPLKISIKNTSDDFKELTFSSGKKYDFWVENDSGKEVWRWSFDKVFTMVLESKKLEPGEQVVYELVWPQKDFDGKQVPAGNYVVKGFSSASELKEIVLGLEVKIVD